MTPPSCYRRCVDFIQRLEELIRPLRAVPAKVRVPLILVPLAATIYFAVTESGPFLWLIELLGTREPGLLSRRVSYHPILTFGLTFVLLCAPSLVALYFLGRRRVKT